MAPTSPRSPTNSRFAQSPKEWRRRESNPLHHRPARAQRRQIDFVIDGRFQAGAKGSDGLVYFLQLTRHTEVITNLANGRFVTSVTPSVLEKDSRVTDNGDGTLTVLVIATGNATLYGEDGKAIGRNPGQIRIELLLDHGGTPNDPDDDVLLSEEVVKGSTGRSDDFCETVVPALS
jgi:hypothetical protein